MTGPDFEHFCQLIRARSGLVLTPEKAYLVNSRLGPVARAEGLAGVPELLARLRAGAPEPLIQRCVEAMATHESFFFRDGAPFEQLANRLLPELIEARRAVRTLRIWCAACSSGQEPYSVAMVLQEAGAQLGGWRLEIVATDMSEPILSKARSGLYSDFEVNRGLSEERLKRWFTREGGSWRIAPQLKQMVSFRTHNLLHGVGGLGMFDVIFCRNVLIYFDVAQKRTILAELARSLAPDGALFLGSAETVIGITDAFTLSPAARGLYLPSSARLARSA
ncbi:chemotaxis protein methyltransferase CheR [Phenylobacterium zucineum HLK1]|uniref:protein-glutamate O-methyltransferase n=1 Tax=Phenylobacterium zucineum (strain HLK1) TaxID=450851 RepID=B4RAP8_PHEZH|nr:protein-glutamate O-methyltransferase CheR [Phenylobacterium zucineum]ACG79646.1 chemotaxis protein methyltransferase CheR [Phenylobacterium zucineum HLK1]